MTKSFETCVGLTLLSAVAMCWTQEARSQSLSSVYAGTQYTYGKSNTNYLGTPNEVSASGSGYWATESAFASANLGLGKLKALAGGTGTYINTSASADFGDGISLFSEGGSAPFSWTPLSTAQISMTVSGSVTDTLGVHDLIRADGTSDNDFYASLNILVTKPGYLSRNERLAALFVLPNPTPADEAEIVRLIDEMNALVIDRNFNYLGTPTFSDAEMNAYATTCGCVLDISTGSTTIDYSFTPNGNFEFLVQLSTRARMSDTVEEHTLMQDFSHTVGLQFTGPAGSYAVANSGSFPGTVSVVPEPSTWLTMVLGLACLGHRRFKQLLYCPSRNKRQALA